MNYFQVKNFYSVTLQQQTLMFYSIIYIFYMVTFVFVFYCVINNKGCWRPR